jgi:hypothetical protein
MEISSYVTGFTDGEGSFLVSFSKRDKMSVGIEVRPAFTVSQHERSKDILSDLQRFFRCGTVRFNKRDRTWKYEVRSLSDLVAKIIPHFNRYPLKTLKGKDFLLFKKVCRLMEQRKHLTVKGIKHIIRIAYGMNNVGARRYPKDSLLQSAGKMKV